MNIFEYAMNMEKEGENFYLEIAAETANEGLKSILQYLANEEVKHYNVLAQMQKEQGPVDMPEDVVFDTTKTVFSKMKKEINRSEFENIEVGFYKKAVMAEKSSYDFYMQKAEEVPNESYKAILKRIAKEEMKHQLVIENIIEFIEKPSQWLENAEWSNIGKDY